MIDGPSSQSVRAALASRGVSVPDDEVEELAAAQAALLEWIAIVEELADGEPVNAGPLPPD